MFATDLGSHIRTCHGKLFTGKRKFTRYLRMYLICRSSLTPVGDDCGGTFSGGRISSNISRRPEGQFDGADRSRNKNGLSVF